MGDRFYTEGNIIADEERLAELQYQMMMDNEEEEEELIDTSEDIDHDDGGLEVKQTNDRVHTQENNYDGGEFFDIHQYKGIYYEEEVGDNEKNHCELTGAHFRYEDAIQKLSRLLETQTKHSKAIEQEQKEKSLKMGKVERVNNVAKVKIILGYDNKLDTVKKETRLSGTFKAKPTNAYQQVPVNPTYEKHLKSVSSQAKQVMTRKSNNSGSRPSFKPQTTRAIPNLNSTARKSTSKTNDRIKGRLQSILVDMKLYFVALLIIL